MRTRWLSNRGIILVSSLCLVLPVLAAAQHDLEVTHIGWESDGPMVVFHLQFHNPGSGMSEAAGGVLSSQPYGAFVPNFGEIGVFNVPPLMPDSFFDITFTVERATLPESAGEITPWDQSGKADSPVPIGEANLDCLPGDHWDGNVDVIWDFGGLPGGMVNYHTATMQVCPEGGNSYIHVVTMCPVGATFAFGPIPAGWSAALVNEDFTPAANPLPSGWSGFICVSAAGSVPTGSSAGINVDFNCGGSTVTVNLVATACDCGVVPEDRSTWGEIKAMFR